MAGVPVDEVRVVTISRVFDGSYLVGFPNEQSSRRFDFEAVSTICSDALIDGENCQPSGKADQVYKAQVCDSISKVIATLSENKRADSQIVKRLLDLLSECDESSAPAKSTIKPTLIRLKEELTAILRVLEQPRPSSNKEVRQAAIAAIPSFIYYSTYGNLDSEIYLPHVIENLERKDLRGKDAAKARTLRVLFDFVGLEPQEILTLGEEKAPPADQSEASVQRIASEARKKKEREVLLQSASSTLTTRFRQWWKQGQYRFRLQADGRHFRIWVSDDKRPEEIELEGRSTGLQWFLSFYLVFLVEKDEEHENSILLLDEPGHSLHPLAQKDLSNFFRSLASDTQLLYTTHSPFLVDPDRLDSVLAVYVDAGGFSVASKNLRAAEEDAGRKGSIYPVHAAVGLSVSDVLLQGCEPVVVEGPSDQIYFAIIKNAVAGSTSLSLRRELVFVPGKGARSVKALSAIISSSNDGLPTVVLDADKEGRETAKSLKDDLYQAAHNRVVTIDQVGLADGREVEDLFPGDTIAACVSRLFRAEQEFEDVYRADQAIVPQIREWAKRNGVELPRGWKVDIAKRVRQRLEGRELEPPASWQKLVTTLIELSNRGNPGA